MTKYLIQAQDFKLDVRVYPNGRAVFLSPAVNWDRTFADMEQAYEQVDAAFAEALKHPQARLVHRVVYANVRELCQQASNPAYWEGPETEDLYGE